MSVPIIIQRTARSYSVTESYHSASSVALTPSARSTPSPSSHPFVANFSENHRSKLWLTEQLPELNSQIYLQKLDVSHILAIYDIYAASSVPGASLPKELKSTFLFAGLMGEREDVVTGVLTSGADINAPDRLNRTPMHIVADRELIHFIPLLMPFKPNIDAPLQDEDSSQNGMTPLHIAVDSGYLEIAQKLLEVGANPEAVDALGRTPFLITLGGCPDMFEFFLNGPVNLLAADVDGNTSLHLSQNQSDIRKLVSRSEELGILEAYLDAANQLGETALIKASKAKSYEMSMSEEKVDFLIRAGASTDVPDAELGTALHWASFFGNQPVVDLLIQAKANVDLHGLDLMTPLHSSICGASPRCAESLLAAGCDKDALDFKGNSPLKIVKLFITSLSSCLDCDEEDSPDNGIFIEPTFNYEINVTGSVQSTIFMLNSIEKRLESSGASEIPILMTPLHLSICEASLKRAESLLTEGCDKDALDFKGNSPLKIVNLFIESLRNHLKSEGKAPLDDDFFIYYKISIIDSVESTISVLNSIKMLLESAGASEISDPKKRFFSPATSPPGLDGPKILAGSASPIPFMTSTQHSADEKGRPLYAWTKV